MHNNFGDLIGTLNHNGIRDVLNNHDSLGNPPGPYSFIYDDSGSGNYPGSQPSDGPGSLRNFAGTEGIGPWMLDRSGHCADPNRQRAPNFNFDHYAAQRPQPMASMSLVQPGTWFYRLH